MPVTSRNTASMLFSDFRSICSRVTVLTDCGVSRAVSCRRVEALSREPETVTLLSVLGSSPVPWADAPSCGEDAPACCCAQAMPLSWVETKTASARGWKAPTKRLRGADMGAPGRWAAIRWLAALLHQTKARRGYEKTRL